jgi:hypothetical protein
MQVAPRKGEKMMAAKTIYDGHFDRKLTLRDAYRAVEHFIGAYHARGESSTAVLLAYIGVIGSGESGDPAALDDFLASVEAVTGVPREAQPR